MKYLSVCSGIEAATVAWHSLGWEPLAFSEIEPFPRKVLIHHYPDVPLHGDFTLLREQDWIKDADILVGGTPCQAFSVAGLRNSLNDDRGNLTLEFVRLADAIDALRSVPSTIVWENVPGVLSVKDNAFGCFLGALAGEDAPLVAPGGRWSNAGFVDGPKRAIAWRILDAQYFGVAQRRRRLFVVASARTDIDPAEILFEFEGLRRDTAPSRGAGERLADSLTVGANQYSGFNGEPVEAHNPEVAQCLTTGVGKRYDPETETLPVVGALGARTGLSIGVQDAQSGHLMVAQPIPLDTMNIKGRPSDERRANRIGRGYGEAGDPMFTITKGNHHAVAQPIAFSGQMSNPQTDVDMTQTLQAKNPMVVAVSSGHGWWSESDGTAQTLRAQDSITKADTLPIVGMAVRRLTPVECERLQGFPDRYTDIQPKGKATPDGPRYKALGNSMAVPVMAWIGKRIANALA